MDTVHKKAINGNWGLIGLLLIASLLWVSVSQAWAETMTFRVSAHIIEIERTQVGDVEGPSHMSPSPGRSRPHRFLRKRGLSSKLRQERDLPHRRLESAQFR